MAILIYKDRQGTDLWIYDLEDDSFRRLTYEGRSNRWPVWTPDGQWITFSSNRDGQFNLYRKRADGSSGAERLLTSQSRQVPSSWSPDGSVLAFSHGAPGNWNTSILAMEAAPKPQPFIGSSQVRPHLRFSPDGQWAAYSWSEKDRSGVYVCRYPEPDIKELVLGSESGGFPVWSPDGSELFYISADSKMMVVSVQTRPTFQAGSPRALFDMRSYREEFDISPDGLSFLMIKKELQTYDGQINVVLNWFEELKRLVPVTTG